MLMGWNIKFVRLQFFSSEAVWCNNIVNRNEIPFFVVAQYNVICIVTYYVEDVLGMCIRGCEWVILLPKYFQL